MSEVRHWVVKGKRSGSSTGYVFDPASMRPGKTSTWVTARPPREWKPGDLLHMWMGSPDLCGVGFATLLSAPEFAGHGVQVEFRLRYMTAPLYAPTTKREALDALGSTPKFLQPADSRTVYPLDSEQSRQLFAIALENNWPDLVLDLSHRRGDARSPLPPDISRVEDRGRRGWLVEVRLPSGRLARKIFNDDRHETSEDARNAAVAYRNAITP